MAQQAGQVPPPPPPPPDAAAVAPLATPITKHQTPEERWGPLLEAVGGAQIVLLGECTHGTAEFYEQRAEITKLLIEQKDFRAVVVEADWPEMQRVARFINANDDRDKTAQEALSGIKDFPQWMWRNEPTRDLVAWLRQHNDAVSEAQRAGQWEKDKCFWFGIDVRSVPEACDQVLLYLEAVDPAYAAEVRKRYAVFDPYRHDMEEYGRALARGALRGQEDVIRVSLERTLAEIQRNSRSKWEWLAGPAEHMNAEQCAEIVVNGEEYYRKRVTEPGGLVTWNTRDQHMVQTLLRLHQQLGGLCRSGLPPKMIVWAHNSHVGDARATELGRLVNEAAPGEQGEQGHIAHLAVGQEWNLGHMVRETFGRQQSFVVGFSTCHGTVSAAPSWGAQVRCYRLRDPEPHTQEEAMGLIADTAEPKTGSRDFYLLFSDFSGASAGDLRARTEKLCKLLGTHARTQRQIGVVYHPNTERRSHFVQVRLPEQVDAMVHIDTTRAVRPLVRDAEWERALARGGEIVDRAD
eukprot:TRINITY_DN10249_c1_g7_i1.p1 TRINITY_DN10249_c1_g7~~TRINITY_DN10249_c1_g7_i1.p1  ORF type:complete len:520 (+),score=154.94 TRINITY_DN10249_c1_g7_i1:104-1663(+)